MTTPDTCQTDTRARPWALLAGLLAATAQATPAVATEADHVLSVGQALTARTPFDHVSSPSGEFVLTVSPDSVQLAQWVTYTGSSSASYSTGTWFRDDGTGEHQSNTDHTTLRVQRNGNLVLRTASGTALWSTHTAGSGATRLVLTNRGNLVLRTPAGKTVWASGSGRVVLPAGAGLSSGQRLVDAWDTGLLHPRRPATLTMQADGNLVHRCGATVLWQTNTHVRGSRLQVTPTGSCARV